MIREHVTPTPECRLLRWTWEGQQPGGCRVLGSAHEDRQKAAESDDLVISSCGFTFYILLFLLILEYIFLYWKKSIESSRPLKHCHSNLCMDRIQV